MNGLFCVAVHALIYLDKRGCMLSSEELAANICTNPARVRKVMAKLKKAGLVTTRTGTDGGYQLTADPAQLTLDVVADALEVRFVEPAWHSGGGVDCGCMVASGMAGVMDALYQELDTLCRQRLSHITLADVAHKIFSGRAQQEPRA